nr:MAG TPA: hypothetical protein [Caudoviricetes sp.]
MLAIAIFILAVKGIQTVCSPFVFTVYDVPHCLRANYKIITTASCFGISINHKAVIRSYCYFFCYG